MRNFSPIAVIQLLQLPLSRSLSLSLSSFCFDFRYSHARSVHNFRSHKEREKGGTELFTVLPFANISFISQLYCCSFTVFRFNCPFHILGTAMKPLTGEQSDGGVEICRSSIVWIASSFAFVRIPIWGMILLLP